MSNINCGIWVLHVKRQILTYFFVMSFLCSLKYLLFQGIQRGVYTKILKIFYGSVFVIWLYLQKAMHRPCDLDLWLIKVNIFPWIDNNPIRVLCEFQIDISTNSWEIKYQNMGIGLLHAKRRTRKNDVKWCPIVTKFGTLIDNMSRTGLYDCHIF